MATKKEQLAVILAKRKICPGNEAGKVAGDILEALEGMGMHGNEEVMRQLDVIRDGMASLTKIFVDGMESLRKKEKKREEK